MTDFWSLVLQLATEDTLSPDQVCVRVLLVSTAEEVTQTIRELQERQFAETRFWTPLTDIPHSNRVVSVLTKRDGQPIA
jgi:hypothetical protein